MTWSRFLVTLACIFALLSSPVHGQEADLEEIAISAATNVSLVNCKLIPAESESTFMAAKSPVGNISPAAVPWYQSPSAKEPDDGTDVVWDERL